MDLLLPPFLSQGPQSQIIMVHLKLLMELLSPAMVLLSHLMVHPSQAMGPLLHLMVLLSHHMVHPNRLMNLQNHLIMPQLTAMVLPSPHIMLPLKAMEPQSPLTMHQLIAMEHQSHHTTLPNLPTMLHLTHMAPPSLHTSLHSSTALPLLSTLSNRLVSAESLIRLQHSRLVLWPPSNTATPSRPASTTKNKPPSVGTLKSVTTTVITMEATELEQFTMPQQDTMVTMDTEPLSIMVTTRRSRAAASGKAGMSSATACPQWNARATAS